MSVLPIFPDGLEVVEWCPVGSQVTVSPPPPLSSSDRDFLVLTNHVPAWISEGGSEGSGNHDESGFVSYRDDDQDLIITTCPEFYKAFKAATHVSKRLNLGDKDDRVALFQAVLYRHEWTPPAVEPLDNYDPFDCE